MKVQKYVRRSVEVKAIQFDIKKAEKNCLYYYPMVQDMYELTSAELPDHPDIREKFIEMGIKSMPVVVVTKGKSIEDIWCDYQIDKIKKWNKAQQNNN